jgi:hypothetical protein
MGLIQDVEKVHSGFERYFERFRALRSGGFRSTKFQFITKVH